MWDHFLLGGKASRWADWNARLQSNPPKNADAARVCFDDGERRGAHVPGAAFVQHLQVLNGRQTERRPRDDRIQKRN